MTTREQELRALQSFGRADLLDATLHAMNIVNERPIVNARLTFHGYIEMRERGYDKESIQLHCQLSEEKTEQYENLYQEREQEEKPDDYCPIGLTRCYSCGTTFKYPVSGCDVCHRSFVD